MSKPKTVSSQTLKSPWAVVNGIFFYLLLALTVFFILSGVSPEIDSHMSGSIGISMLTNSEGKIVLYPTPGMEAEKAGVKNFDILLKINGVPIRSGGDINKQLSGRVGEPLTITVRSSDGSEKTYTIVRTSEYQGVLEKAGLTASALAAFYVILSLLVGLGFAVMAAILLSHRLSVIQSILTAYVLLLLPYSLNAVSLIYGGATAFHLEWLYIALRVIGLFLGSTLLFFFPNGPLLPKWMRWGLIGVGIWAVLYYLALINPKFLPGSWIDLVWIVIIAFGLAEQIYRYRSVSSEMERQPARQMGNALLVALAAYVVIWLLELFLSDSTLNSASGVWFYLIAELLVDAGFVFFGLSLMLTTRKTQ
jgi:hypothetical protein